MNRLNPILNVDSYKASHYLQYPPGTTRVSSYIESRGGVADHTLFFGLQMYLKEYLTQPITAEDIDEAEELFIAHGLRFNRPGWEIVLNRHAGLLPVSIEAVAEGTILPVRNVMAQVVNTDPDLPWVTSYAETAMLRAIWYPTSVASQSLRCKQTIARYLEETADSTDGLMFKLHDFGARGASSFETAAIGGLAHLVNFMGTDTVGAIVAARRFYGEPMAGFSIPASEHSTMTAWGREGEADAYRNMLDQFSGKGKLVAVVSDSYDLWNALDNIWGGELRDQVINQGGTVVIRPDSGDPVEIVKQTIEHLMLRFGHTVNGKGYRLLPDYIRVIQGDGISPTTIGKILEAMKQTGLSADNIAFGMGAELLQKVNRDTFKFAMKCSAAEINGQWRDVFKVPVTDPGKASKAGRLALIRGFEGVETVRADQLSGRTNLLQEVFRNGKLLKEWNFSEVRKNASRG